MDRRAFLATGAATVGALAGCLGRKDAGGYDVAMVSDGYVPQTTISVPDSAPSWVPRGVPTFETSVGDTVVWENTGSRDHTVTAATKQHPKVEAMLGASGDDHHGTPRLPSGASFFSSGDFKNEVVAAKSFLHNLNGGGVIAPGERYTHTFETPGWFHYYCIPHEPAGMMGNVHVLQG